MLCDFTIHSLDTVDDVDIIDDDYVQVMYSPLMYLTVLVEKLVNRHFQKMRNNSCSNSISKLNQNSYISIPKIATTKALVPITTMRQFLRAKCTVRKSSFRNFPKNPLWPYEFKIVKNFLEPINSSHKIYYTYLSKLSKVEKFQPQSSYSLLEKFQ